jgi:hypothetical protein
MAHRPQVGWITAIGSSTMAFYHDHETVVVCVAVVLVAAVIVDMIVHLKRKAAAKLTPATA